jgi:hypothetical protein
MYSNNDILFPHHVIATLKRLRGAEWEKLVERITKLPENHEETIAFMLMMVRLNGCMACETDSYRAMRGCASCAQQTLRRWKGDDEELLEMFDKALADVRKWATGNSTYQLQTSEK